MEKNGKKRVSMAHSDHSAKLKTNPRYRPIGSRLKNAATALLVVASESPSGLIWTSTGKPAGFQEKNGYWRVQLLGRRFSAARLVWIIEKGEDPWPLTVDHVDRNRSNNCVQNLRVLTPSQQQYNRGKKSGTKSSYKYVVWDKKGSGRWLARYKSKSIGKVVHVGTFKNDYDAHLASIAHRLEHEFTY